MTTGRSSQNANWPTVTLGEVAEQCLGKMLDAKKNKGRLLPYLRNPNVRWFEVDTSNLQMMPFEDHEVERYGLREGDVVVCEGGEAGRAAIWDGRLPELKFQKAIHRVRPGPRLHNRYFVHRLKADHQSGRLADYFTGATIKHLTGQDLARYEFPLPPLEEQQRIVEVLDPAEALRAKRRIALAQLDTLTQAIFLNMFGDPATNPKAWPATKLGDIISVGPQNGLYKPASDYGSGTPILRIDAFYDGVVTRLTDLKRVRISEEEITLYGLRPGEIVINRVNSREYLGKSALIPALSEPVVFESNMMRFDVDHGVLDPGYLIQYLQTRHVRAHILQCAKDAVNQSSINQQDVKALPVVVPSFPVQKEFVRRVAAVACSSKAHRASLAQLDVLFASLQHRAFRGEL